ncbi:MAG TPA: Rieske 2Fe-2S domain-containing protein [Chloroflexota bacterium]|nr:Rieske 2Fe-2S domain-containing protein [Chloroflexota bacterium]
MLTKEENALLTQIGPGTPCGELLRRYWHPVALTRELTDDRPMRRVKILGEELVLFRQPDGAFGLVGEHCSHRGTSLYYGFLEDGGIRCPYHGWLYDAVGRCVEQPFEPAQSMLKHTLRHPAYPVQELAGILFAYLGPPERQPLLPRWDVLVWEGGIRTLRRQQTLSCNWLQAEENSADVTHTYFLHGHAMKAKGLQGGQYYYRPIERFGFQPFEFGLLKSWHYQDGGTRFGEERGGGNPLIFPNMLRVREGAWHAIHWRVPIDDAHTEIFWAGFMRDADVERGRWLADADREGEVRLTGPNGEYTMDTFPSQDTMAWETQGAIFDRGREHLGASDQGIALFRQMLRDQIEAVQRGDDPMALVRDPERNRIIEVPEWVAEFESPDLTDLSGTSPTFTSMADVFDERHQVFEVPFGAARPRAS